MSNDKLKKATRAAASAQAGVIEALAKSLRADIRNGDSASAATTADAIAKNAEAIKAGIANWDEPAPAGE